MISINNTNSAITGAAEKGGARVKKIVRGLSPSVAAFDVASFVCGYDKEIGDVASLVGGRELLPVRFGLFFFFFWSLATEHHHRYYKPPS